MNKHVQIRGWESTRRNLKILAAILGETMIGLLDRLIRDEARRKNIDLPEDG